MKTENLSYEEAIAHYAAGNRIMDASGYEYWIKNGVRHSTTKSGSFDFPVPGETRFSLVQPKPMTANQAMRAGKIIRITTPYQPFDLDYLKVSPGYPTAFIALAREADRAIAAGEEGWGIEVLD